MIPQSFEYSAPTSLKEALSLLAGGDAKVLAGGMTLVPLMKLRLAAPGHVVDLRHVPDLNFITEEGGNIHVGAMTTHYDIESSPLLRGKCPLLPETASCIGDVQVRNMGTIGGSIAHADPAADYPAPLLALEAQVRLASARGERTLRMDQFLVDTLTTALDPGEIVVELILPAEPAGAGTSYQKLEQPASGFAVVGVAARLRRSAGKINFARVGITGVGPKAYRAAGAERVLLESGDIHKAAAMAAEGVEVNADLFASAAYRRHLTQVYTARALEQALSRMA